MQTDSYQVSVVIPNHNHGSALLKVLEKIPSSIFCVVVDDASTDSSVKNILSMIENRQNVDLLRCYTNGGKGKAVMEGAFYCREKGYSHILQIDADGQHEISDIQKFIQISQDHPESLIAGQPIYDETVPLTRFIFRYLTHICVYLETCSFQIKDSMCGFRVYPLKSLCESYSKKKLGSHMDFDTEVMVRLYREQVPVIQLPTRVHYPKNGHSNFRLLLDNVMISWMHTRLLLSLVPWLVSRQVTPSGGSAKNPVNSWARMKERGSIGGLKFLLFLYKIFGRQISLLVTKLVVSYFFITDADKRRCSRNYFRRLHLKNTSVPAPSSRETFKQYLEFGICGLDKIDSWYKPSSFKLKWSGHEETKRLFLSGGGGVIFSAHLGNLEVLRSLMRGTSGAHTTALMFTQNAEKFNQILKAIVPDSDRDILCVESITPHTAIHLQEKVKRGEFVAITVDRLPPGVATKSVELPFFGSPIRVPQGPFVLASLLEVPIYFLSCTRCGDREYEVRFEKLHEKLLLPRQKREAKIRELAEVFFKNLEEECQKNPHQWFNFYDYWRDDESNK